MGPPHEGSTHRTKRERSTSELRPAPKIYIVGHWSNQSSRIDAAMRGFLLFLFVYFFYLFFLLYLMEYFNTVLKLAGTSMPFYK